MYLPHFSPESEHLQSAEELPDDICWSPPWQPETCKEKDNDANETSKPLAAAAPPLLAAQYSTAIGQMVWSPAVNDMKISNPKVGNSHRREICGDLQLDPLAIFLHFFPRVLVERWVRYTNTRYERRRQEHQHRNQKPTTYAEILVFFAMLIYMSVHRERQFRAYWAVRDDLPCHPVRRWLTRNRFVWLYRFFCVWDPVENVGSIWERTGEWTRSIMTKTLSIWKPGFYVAVDESMIRFQGRCIDKTMMKSKPIPIGLKIFVIAEKGVILGYAPYTRNGIEMPSLQYMTDESSLAETRAVVAHLAISLLPHLPFSSEQNPYQLHVFADNLFTNVELAQYLYRRKILYTGTARSKAYGGIDARFSAIKAYDDTKKTIPWGTLFSGQATRKGSNGRKTKAKELPSAAEPADVNQIAWKDGQTVLFLSTAYTGLEKPIVKKRKRPAAGASHARTSRIPFGDKGEADLPVPLISAAYNMNMNSVDIADQYRADTAHQRRIRRGAAQALMYDFNIGTAVTNAFLTFRELARNADDPRKKITQADFRKEIYNQLVTHFGQSTVPKWSVDSEPSRANHRISKASTRRDCIVCSRSYQQKILGRRVMKKVQVRTRWECQACKKPLCNKDLTERACFDIAHEHIN